MSRIGKKPIPVPKGVDVKVDGALVSVKGPKGNLQRSIHDTISVEMEGDKVVVKMKRPCKEHSKFYGLSRTLVANMVEGVSQGFTKSLSLVGVGYRAAPEGKGLKLTLGFSHPVVVEPIDGIDFKVDKQTTIHVSGASKEDVGQVAAKIRSFRPPEPYHGKGVRYIDERIIKKAGKASGKK